MSVVVRPGEGAIVGMFDGLDDGSIDTDGSVDIEGCADGLVDGSYGPQSPQVSGQNTLKVSMRNGLPFSLTMRSHRASVSSCTHTHRFFSPDSR